MVHIRVAELPEASTHLVGATLGQLHARAVASRLPGTDAAHATCLLDFTGAETATASYLKAFVLALVRAGQAGVVAMEGTAPPKEAPGNLRPLNAFVAVTGLSGEIAEELVEVCASQRVPVCEAKTWTEGSLGAVVVHGPVDRALWDTLEAVAVAGPSTATSLMEAHRSHVRITVTGWNNRLAELHRLCLVQRGRAGRQWVYAPVAPEVRRG